MYHTIQTIYCNKCKNFHSYCTSCLFDNNGYPKKCISEELKRHNANKIVANCIYCQES